MTTMQRGPKPVVTARRWIAVLGGDVKNVQLTGRDPAITRMPTTTSGARGMAT